MARFQSGPLALLALNDKRSPGVLIPLLVLALAAALLVFPGLSTAYNTSSHDLITFQAIRTLSADGKPEMAQLAEEYLERLRQGSWDADYSRGTIFGIPLAATSHYYNPVTRKGLLGSESSAAVLAQSSYDQAVQKWEAGDRSGAMYTLGFALHVLQDVTVPHHTLSTPGVLTHQSYENYLEKWMSAQPEWISGGGEYSTKPPGQWVHDNAALASTYWSLVDGFAWSGNPKDDFTKAASELVPVAIRTSAGFLATFFERVGVPSSSRNPELTLLRWLSQRLLK